MGEKYGAVDVRFLRVDNDAFFCKSTIRLCMVAIWRVFKSVVTPLIMGIYGKDEVVKNEC